MNEDKYHCRLDADSQYVELAVEVFTMLADATRVRIILALRDGELSVNHLADIIDKSPTAVSQHLAKLRADGLVEFRRASQTLHYRVADQRALRLLQVLKDIYCGDLK